MKALFVMGVPYMGVCGPAMNCTGWFMDPMGFSSNFPCLPPKCFRPRSVEPDPSFWRVKFGGFFGTLEVQTSEDDGFQYIKMSDFKGESGRKYPLCTVYIYI